LWRFPARQFKESRNPGYRRLREMGQVTDQYILIMTSKMILRESGFEGTLGRRKIREPREAVWRTMDSYDRP
jgi:hypothetical protein